MALLPVLLLPLASCLLESQTAKPAGSVRLLPAAEYAGSFPRFPHDPRARTLRDVMVLYSPDDLFSNITWESIGYPDAGIFMVHNAFPQLKVTLQAVPENRYLGEIPNRNIEKDPVAARIWRDLFSKPEFRSWLEFGNHGYYHSPPGDPDLDHHEFDGKVNPAAYDSAFCYGAFTKARDTYAAIGLDNDRINVMRFPGCAFTPMALRALVDHGFLAYFDAYRSGREWVVPLEGKREILAIPTVTLDGLFEGGECVRQLQERNLDSAGFASSPAYRALLDKAAATLDEVVRDGGVVNFFNHWWEHSQPRINGVRYRFDFFRDLLSGLDTRYGKRIWWGFGSELARWAYLKRNAPVSITGDGRSVTVDFGQPPAWRPGWAMTASYTLSAMDAPEFRLPAGIRYTLASEGHAKTHDLGPEDYWVEGNRLHFNFPYSGAMKVIIAIDPAGPAPVSASSRAQSVQ